MRSVRILAGAVVCLMAACAKGDKSESVDSAARVNASAAEAAARGTAASGCIEGVWKKQDGNFTQTFTFKPDKTGEEVQSRADIRTFTWSMKDPNTVHIVYTTQGSANTEWDLAVDCQNNKFASLYSK